MKTWPYTILGHKRGRCIFLQSHWPTEYSLWPSSANGTLLLERANIARFQESRTCRSTATSARKATRCSDALRSLQCIHLFACSIPIGVGVSADCHIHAMWIETPEQTEQTEQTPEKRYKRAEVSVTRLISRSNIEGERTKVSISSLFLPLLLHSPVRPFC